MIAAPPRARASAISASENGSAVEAAAKARPGSALGAWYAHSDPAMGYLAKCRTFDEQAVSEFFSAFQFNGPEHFDPSDLRPGH